MIIIKTTDNKIVKLEAVVINSQVNQSLGGLTSSGVYYILGSYESEERAKEVMEEIEGHIVDCYNSRYWMERYPKDYKFDIVFEMPKE